MIIHGVTHPVTAGGTICTGRFLTVPPTQPHAEQVNLPAHMVHTQLPQQPRYGLIAQNALKYIFKGAKADL